jgi:hypothetical protein
LELTGLWRTFFAYVVLALVAEVGKSVDLTHACAKNGGNKDGVMKLSRPLFGSDLNTRALWAGFR